MVSFNAILDYKQSVFTFAPFGPSPPKVHVCLRYCFLSRRCSFRNGFSIEIILHRKLLLIPNPRASNRISYDFKPKAAQMLQIGSTLKQFGPKAAQMLKIISFVLISDHLLSDGFLQPRSSFRSGPPFVTTLHSKWLSIRNGFGITPKGPTGPSPPSCARAARRTVRKRRSSRPCLRPVEARKGRLES